jgi:hypothetical protein
LAKQVDCLIFLESFFYSQSAFTFVTMARFALLLVCFTILVQSVQRTWIVASWKINQSYIAANLCENRLEQKSCCAGSCYLNKELAANEQKEQSAPANEKTKSELICNVFAYDLVVNHHQGIFFTTHSIVWKQGQPQQASFTIFHPPLS